MRRYKFQTNEDAVELLRNMVKDSGVVFLTSIKGETFEETSDYVASVILAGGYVGTFMCYGTYHRRVLSCLFHTQNRHIRTLIIHSAVPTYSLNALFSSWETQMKNCSSFCSVIAPFPPMVCLSPSFIPIRGIRSSHQPSTVLRLRVRILLRRAARAVRQSLAIHCC